MTLPMHETTTACSDAALDQLMVPTLPPPPIMGDCERRAADHSADEEPLRVVRASLRFDVALPKDAFGLGIYFSEAPSGRAVVDPALPFYRLPDDAEAPGERSRAIAPGDVLCAIDGRSLETLAFPLVVDELRRLTTGVVTLAFERPMPVRMAALTVQLPSRLTAPVDQPIGSPGLGEPHPDMDGRSVTGDSDALTTASAASDAQQTVKEQRRSVFQRWTGSSTDAAGVSTLEQLLVDAEAKLQTADAALEREKKCRFLAEKKNILYRNELLRVSGESSALRFELSRQQSGSCQREEFCLRKLHLAI